MGKFEEQQEGEASDSSGTVCNGCSFLLPTFTFKCLFILFITFSAFFSSLFWILPNYNIKLSFDAKDQIKHSATVQASFKLEKPVSQLIPYIERLEYDIYGEIGLPHTKVAILSMHQSVEPNWTDVVIGVLSDPMNVSINPVSLSVLRSSLIELYLQQSNLTLTTSIFGNASLFEILKIPSGITVIPVQSASIWQIPQVLFNFTLDNSISDVLDNFTAFKDELKFGLQLKFDECVYVLFTNGNGSTLIPPVSVQASVMSGFGGLLPQRLKQLAQTIRNSSAKNLGLDNSMFGKVKDIKLSSLLNDTMHAISPSPSPASSPQFSDHSKPPASPYRAPSYSPISPATSEQPPCFDCEVSSPAPSIATAHPPDPCPYSGFIYHSTPSPKSYSPLAAAPTSHSSGHTRVEAPDPSPIDDLSSVSKLRQGDETSKKVVSELLAPSSFSSSGDDLHSEILLLGFCMLLVSLDFLHDATF
ncbi:hypothetical protein TanjilG_07954 [Lupinus angustifolius]|uniref:DUF7036 domain-containing protein n=1 Tax=Lupinus angustifolius TaxID=3871 RepID=A0A4P1RLX0_LUPAN|nr:PREDICTED: uncharacterized protein LOC109345690 [Lupinus angustifolius]OIW13612.1 hypothetical protein TanjilG_07954 [Lupinus angustifolius]